MTLVDSSVWIDHLRSAVPALQVLLSKEQVLSHPFVIGEIALGTLRARAPIMEQLSDLEPAQVATDAEVMTLIERHAIWGLGIGYVDAHLLAAARLADASLWTHDKRLHAVAVRLGLAA